MSPRPRDCVGRAGVCGEPEGVENRKVYRHAKDAAPAARAAEAVVQWPAFCVWHVFIESVGKLLKSGL